MHHRPTVIHIEAVRRNATSHPHQTRSQYKPDDALHGVDAPLEHLIEVSVAERVDFAHEGGELGVVHAELVLADEDVALDCGDGVGEGFGGLVDLEGGCGEGLGGLQAGVEVEGHGGGGGGRAEAFSDEEGGYLAGVVGVWVDYCAVVVVVV